MNGRMGETASGRDNHLPRIWTEPRVRFWWLAVAVLIALGIGYSVDGFLDWKKEADLIHNGTLVQATIREAGGGLTHGLIPEDAAWDVKFTLNGLDKEVTGFPSVNDGRHSDGDVVPIYVDPADPAHWTNRRTAPPLVHELTGLLFIIPAILICFLLGVIRALRLGKIAQGSNTGDAQILSLGHSALAPRSYTARCAWTDERNRTIYSVFIPRHLQPQTGDTIQIAAAAKSSLAIVISEKIQRAE